MIDLYYWPTPNGWKISIFLEEAGLPYRLVPVDIGAGAQFEPSFLAIAPNNRMPAIVDHAPADGGPPVSVFESGAILLYLAEKTGQFLPSDLRGRAATLEWLFWQMGGLGPMLGQAGHFRNYAAERHPYAIDRYTNESDRLFGVLERRLERVPYLAGDALSIADFASLPWVHAAPKIVEGLLERFPAVTRWHDALVARPGVRRGLDVGRELRRPLTDAEKAVLFNQTSGR